MLNLLKFSFCDVFSFVHSPQSRQHISWLCCECAATSKKHSQKVQKKSKSSRLWKACQHVEGKDKKCNNGTSRRLALDISIKRMHSLSCRQGEFVLQSRASLVGDHFLYSHDLNVWFRGDIAWRNWMLVTLRSQRVNFFLSGFWGGFNWVSFGDSSISLVLLYFVDCDWSVNLLQSSLPVWFCIFCFFVAFFKDVKDKTFLEVINRYVEVHGTVGGGVSIVAT